MEYNNFHILSAYLVLGTLLVLKTSNLHDKIILQMRIERLKKVACLIQRV
jgi:hypothetical protein